MSTTQTNAAPFWKPDIALPQVPAKWWEALLVALLAPAVFLIVSIVVVMAVYAAIYGLPENLSASPQPLPPPFTPMLFGSICAQVTTLTFIFGYVKLRGQGKIPAFKTLGFRFAKVKAVAKALAVAVVVLILIQLVGLLLPKSWSPSDTFVKALTNATGLQTGLMVVAACVLAPLVEETVLRGYLFAALDNRFGFVVAALLSSAVFGIMHFPGASLILAAFVLGLVLCWVYKKTGSLWTVIGLHAVSNSVAVVLVLIGSG